MQETITRETVAIATAAFLITGNEINHLPDGPEDDLLETELLDWGEVISLIEE